jgi:hypothetical protein
MKGQLKEVLSGGQEEGLHKGFGHCCDTCDAKCFVPNPFRSHRTSSHGRDYIRTDARSPDNGDYSYSDSDSSVDSVVERSRRLSSSGQQYTGNHHHCWNLSLKN